MNGMPPFAPKKKKKDENICKEHLDSAVNPNSQSLKSQQAGEGWGIHNRLQNSNGKMPLAPLPPATEAFRTVKPQLPRKAEQQGTASLE